jgi:3-oxoacyl-[acyl-carrier protein] reductase
MQLYGRVAIVTGGGTGLGRTISLRLGAAGAVVAVNYPGADEQEAIDTVAEIRRGGGQAVSLKADMADPAQIESMVESVSESHGGVDVLINNAARTSFIAFPDLDALDPDEWDRTLEVNCRGPYLAARAVAPSMKARGAGVIVNITSASASRGTSSSSIAYSVSKAGLQMLTECLAFALAPEIRVNSVAPGGMLTRWGQRWGAAELERQAEALPLKHHAEITDVADAVLFAIANDSLTGQSIFVDSGWLIA